jgi:hypothetical protein
MITQVLVNKETLCSLLVFGFGGVKQELRNELKILVGITPAINSPDDVCLVFSDGVKESETEGCSIIKLRLRIPNKEKE